MKFKKNKAEPGTRYILVKDGCGDTFAVETSSFNDDLWFVVNREESDAKFVQLSRNKALKLARAIIAELDPEAV